MRRRIACVLAAAVMLSSMPVNAITSYAQEAQMIEEMADVATSSDAEEEVEESENVSVEMEDTLLSDGEETTIDLGKYSISSNIYGTYWIDDGLDNLADLFSVVLYQNGVLVETVDPQNYDLYYSEYNSITGYSDWVKGLPTESGKYQITAFGKNSYSGRTMGNQRYLSLYYKHEMQGYHIEFNYSNILTNQELKMDVGNYTEECLNPSNYVVQYADYQIYQNNNYSLEGIQLSDETPKEPGKYICVATGVGKYTGSTVGVFTIQSHKLLDWYYLNYNHRKIITGENIADYLELRVNRYGVSPISCDFYQYMFCKEDEEIWSSENPIEAGKYKVKAVGINGYSGETRAVDLTIYDSKDISSYKIACEDKVHSGENLDIEIYADIAGDKLCLDKTEYEIAYAKYEDYLNNSQSLTGLEMSTDMPSVPGDYLVVVNGVGDYYGIQSKVFSIKDSKDLSWYTIYHGYSEMWTDQSVDDLKKDIIIYRLNSDTQEKEFVDADCYDVLFSKNDDSQWSSDFPTELGLYKVKAVGKGEYSGDAYLSLYLLSGYDLSSYQVYCNDRVWTDTVTDFQDKLKIGHTYNTSLSSEFYDVYYTSSDGERLDKFPEEPGEYTVWFKGKNGFTGTTASEFTFYDMYDIQSYYLSMDESATEGIEYKHYLYRDERAGYKEEVPSEENYRVRYWDQNTSYDETNFIDGWPQNPGVYTVILEGISPYYGKIYHDIVIYGKQDLRRCKIDCPNPYIVNADNGSFSVVGEDTNESVPNEKYTLSYVINQYDDWDNVDYDSIENWETGIPHESGRYIVRAVGKNGYKGSCYKMIRVVNLNDDNVVNMLGSSMHLTMEKECSANNIIKINPQVTAEYYIETDNYYYETGFLMLDEAGNILMPLKWIYEIRMQKRLEKGKAYYLVFLPGRETFNMELVVKRTGTADSNPHIHSQIVAPAIAPTCTTKGKTAGSRCVCGYVLEKQTDIAQLGHAWKNIPATAATCTQAGLSEGLVCERCGEIGKKQVEIPATSHTFGDYVQTVAPTAVAEGVNTRKCTACGVEETAPIAKLTPTMKMNVTSITLKVKQSTKAVKVSGLAVGDRVQSWKSSNTKIVKVANSGKITAGTKTGNATITVTLASGLSKKLKVKVQKKDVACTKVKLSDKKLTLKKGKNKKLVVTVQPITCIQKASFKTSNKKVATVDSKGKIVAKGKGKATITVTVGKKKATCKVTVK
ncbi:MAG: Ig-like domain-containing protein [Wujia sp.]